jgi:CheY-like chemotaxis protein
MRRTNIITAQLLRFEGASNSSETRNVLRPASSPRACLVLRRFIQVGALAFLLCQLGVSAAEPGHPTNPTQPAAITSQEALEKFIAHQEASLTNQLRTVQQQAQASGSSDGFITWMMILAGVVTAIIALRGILPALASPFLDEGCPGPPSLASTAPDAHEEAFSGYLKEVNAQQKPGAAGAPSNLATGGESADLTVALAAAPRSESAFLDHVSALDQVMSVRALFLELNRLTDSAPRKEALAKLLEAIRGMRKGLRVSAAYPVGQMASALEGLLSQVAERPENLSASVVRTIAGAIDLLPSLCGPGIRSDLASNPPIALLAVDDDAVIRHALSCALKRVWARPDVAKDGQEGLGLAEARAYDLVFLDIEMPGMDGFELCYRIHATTPNAVTPVVFVTSHNDLASRAKSSLVGGLEFLGKPFLSGELTLKALTLVLMRRLQASLQRVAPTSQNVARASSPIPVVPQAKAAQIEPVLSA